MTKVFYVPWLHMHQPLVWKDSELVSNLEVMIFSQDQAIRWNGLLIARAYKNPARYVKELKERGYEPRIMLDFSGVLLESLDKMKNLLKKIEVRGERIGDIIQLYKEVLRKYPENMEFAGTAYSHCYFPATPEKDWRLQIEEWRNVFKKFFGKKCLERVRGFWLPEMGVPGFEDKLERLIREVKRYYEWLILPVQSIKDYEKLSYKEVIKIASQPHLLEIGKEKIVVIFRVPTYFIDQQAGCDANLLYSKLKEVSTIFESKKPALIVPASDGENGNVMMNEFFPNTFVPFFTSKINRNISSLTVSQFLDDFYSKKGELEVKRKIELKSLGASWVDGHELWLKGTKRQEMFEKIVEMSKVFHSLKKSEKRKLKKLLLIAETSCYVYWGSEYWFEQGLKTIKEFWLRMK